MFLFLRLLAVFSLSGLLCQCQHSLHTGKTDQEDASVFVRVMMQDVKEDMDWMERKPSHGKSQNPDPDAFMREARRLEFHKATDSTSDLLQRARKGEGLALGKLQSYVSMYDEKWAFRFELERMLALGRGVAGVASYYATTKNHWKLRRERRLIELAIRQLEDEAVNGGWMQAVALYHFLGTLQETDVRLPWGGNREMSAKWLELLQRLKGRDFLVKVAKNEASRMGLVQREFFDGSYFPHTPEGWKPAQE